MITPSDTNANNLLQQKDAPSVSEDLDKPEEDSDKRKKDDESWWNQQKSKRKETE